MLNKTNIEYVDYQIYQVKVATESSDLIALYKHILLPYLLWAAKMISSLVYKLFTLYDYAI